MSIEEKVICPMCGTERGITKRRTIERHNGPSAYVWLTHKTITRQCRGSAQPVTDEMVREWITKRTDEMRAFVERCNRTAELADEEVVKAQARAAKNRDEANSARTPQTERPADLAKGGARGGSDGDEADGGGPMMRYGAEGVNCAAITRDRGGAATLR